MAGGATIASDAGYLTAASPIYLADVVVPGRVPPAAVRTYGELKMRVGMRTTIGSNG